MDSVQDCKWSVCACVCGYMVGWLEFNGTFNTIQVISRLYVELYCKYYNLTGINTNGTSEK